MASNRCICCGAEIPEGRQVCPSCEKLKTADELLERLGFFRIPNEYRFDRRYECDTGDALEVTRHGVDISFRYSMARFRIGRDYLFAIAKLVKEMEDEYA